MPCKEDKDGWVNKELGRNLELAFTSDIYIEAGDHEHLIWVDRHEFRKLMEALPHAIISKDVEVGCWK